MGSALFWGMLLIILGLSFIFRIVFNIDFPVFKIFIAFVFIFLGFRILFGNFGINNLKVEKNNVIFGERNFNHFKDETEYNVIFGSGTFDFRDFKLSDEREKIKINTVFGANTIKISRDTPVRINIEAAFAGVDLPNGNSAIFGNSHYESPGLDKDKAYLDIKLDVVFGGADIHLY